MEDNDRVAKIEEIKGVVIGLLARTVLFKPLNGSLGTVEDPVLVISYCFERIGVEKGTSFCDQ